MKTDRAAELRVRGLATRRSLSSAQGGAAAVPIVDQASLLFVNTLRPALSRAHRTLVPRIESPRSPLS